MWGMFFSFERIGERDKGGASLASFVITSVGGEVASSWRGCLMMEAGTMVGWSGGRDIALPTSLNARFDFWDIGMRMEE
jgi:hypothetical protein